MNATITIRAFETAICATKKGPDGETRGLSSVAPGHSVEVHLFGDDTLTVFKSETGDVCLDASSMTGEGG